MGHGTNKPRPTKRSIVRRIQAGAHKKARLQGSKMRASITKLVRQEDQREVGELNRRPSLEEEMRKQEKARKRKEKQRERQATQKRARIEAAMGETEKCQHRLNKHRRIIADRESENVTEEVALEVIIEDATEVGVDLGETTPTQYHTQKAVESRERYVSSVKKSEMYLR